MLDYENQIFLDVLDEDQLVVSAKGLGMESVILNLLKVYSDPGNLVLVLGATPHEERHYISRLERQGVFPLPRVITSESGSAAERLKVYMEGGVLFVSPRILVVDLLKERLPVGLVTGVFVCRAHSVAHSCQEAFALRLYRQKNKTGFIKAFTSSAQALTAGFAQVSRIMRMLFLKQLKLWPRFQATIQGTLRTFQPTVVEMHVQPTPAMTRIQNAILELMTFTVKELHRMNPTLDLEELTVENAIAKSFHKILQLQLDPVWHQISSKTKTLVADLKLFRVILNHLFRYDCVTFHTFVSTFRSRSYAVSSSGWLVLDAANVMFSASAQRVLGEADKCAGEEGPAKTSRGSKRPGPAPDPPAKASKLSLSLRGRGSRPEATSAEGRRRPLHQLLEDSGSEGEEADDDPRKEGTEEPAGGGDDGQEVNPEPNPKWTVLKEILSEIRETSKSSREGAEATRDKVLILVEDRRTARQLQSFLVEGARRMLARLHRKSRAGRRAGSDRGYTEHNLRSPGKLFRKFHAQIEEGLEVELNTQVMSRHKEEVEGTTEAATDIEEAEEEEEEEASDVYVLSQRPKCDRRPTAAGDDAEGTYEVIANQTVQLDETLKSENEVPSMPEAPLLIIQTFKTGGDPLSLPETLEEVRPRFVVMYNVDITVTRRIEVYQAVNPRLQVHVYFMVFGGSVEEQAYLTSLRRENQAFDQLIKEKETMVVPEDQDGKSEHCEALSRDASRPGEAASTRRGGPSDDPSAKGASTIVVDMREFNSELPSMIHRRGIDVYPVTLQVGDYVLSPDICVERKSVSDLIGSLNHGRLYNQAKAMTRYYTNPVLLIEFNQNKPMTLQGNYYISNDMSSNDVSAKLILLTLHFPQLKVIWSPSPFATAQLFEELKGVRDEPDPVKAAEVGADLEQDLDMAERFNPGVHDLVARLPGTSTRNIHKLLGKGQSLDHLARLSKEELTKLVDNSQEAESLHNAFHGRFRPPETAADKSSLKRGGAAWRGRGRGFRR